MVSGLTRSGNKEYGRRCLLNKLRLIVFVLLFFLLTGCNNSGKYAPLSLSFSPYDIPFIGWRLEIADQQKELDKKRKCEQKIGRQFSWLERRHLEPNVAGPNPARPDLCVY